MDFQIQLKLSVQRVIKERGPKPMGYLCGDDSLGAGL